MRYLNSRRQKISDSVRALSHTEIRAIRVMKRQRAHARFRVHHETFRELHADLFRPQTLPDSRLIFQVRASRIPKAVSLPALARGDSFRHRHLRRVWEAPILADSPVQPFRASL